MLFPKLDGASKTMTPSSVTRNADCHPLSEITYTPPPTLLTAYPSFGSICQKFAFTEGKTGTYFCKFSGELTCEDRAETCPAKTVANIKMRVFILRSPCGCRFVISLPAAATIVAPRGITRYISQSHIFPYVGQ